MRAETTGTVSTYRKSIRITSQYSYTGGLVVLDAVHMPTGCGTWPAFWSNGTCYRERYDVPRLTLLQ